jgi:hypothetical protein
VEAAVKRCPEPLLPAPAVAEVGRAMEGARQAATGRRRKAPPSFEPLPLAPEDERALDLALAYRCAARGDEARDPEVAYARARLYFERWRWAEAAVLFEEIAFDPGRYADARHAAQLWYEAANLLPRAAGRKRAAPAQETACASLMRDMIPRFVSLFCDGYEERRRRPCRHPCVCGDPLCVPNGPPCCERDDFCEGLGRIQAAIDAHPR